jgi:hypothetical protein
VGLLSGIFLALAGIDHLFVGTVGRSMYEEYLAKKQNPFRWLEYSISASFMHIQVRYPPRQRFFLRKTLFENRSPFIFYCPTSGS